jgi:transcriptional regulator with XRE-family HTH domain
VSQDQRFRLGQRLAEQRRAARLSQGEVAARIGWDTAGPVYGIERGLRLRMTRRDLLAYLGAIGSEDAELRAELISMWRQIKRTQSADTTVAAPRRSVPPHCGAHTKGETA